MWKNYLKIAFRNIWKQKTFSLINIMGLALGLACCFLTILYVSHEASYDAFHPNLDRLYRINYKIDFGSVRHFARIPPPVAPRLRAEFPELEAVTRFYPRNISVKLPSKQQQFELENVCFVDTSAQKVFGFSFIYGNPQTALKEPFSVVLSDETAQFLFGRTDVIGEQLSMAESNNFKVTGVVKAWPDQAHIQFKMLVPYENMIDVEPAYAQEQLKGILESNWIATHSHAYVLLKKGHQAEAVNARFAPFIQKHGMEQFRDKQDFSLYPVKDIHLHSTVEGEARPTASLPLLYLFLSIGLVALLIACINFVNLSTAGSLSRAKEVGVRKVLGAKRRFLISQFLGESLVLGFFAFLLAMLMVLLSLPSINELTGLEIVFNPLKQYGLLGAFALIAVVVGLLAGSYPAFYVSRFVPVKVLKGGSDRKPGGTYIRKALITLQFLVAIAFISGAAIVYMQLDFLRNQPLGFEKELILSVPISSDANINALFRPGDPDARQRMNTYDEEIQKNPNIHAVTQCGEMPGLGSISRNVWNDLIPQSENFFALVTPVDYDYVETMGLEMAAGRDFDASFGTDHLSSFVINEKAVERLNWESAEAALGQNLVVEGKEGKVVGVVKNYHVQSLRDEIDPFIMEVRPGAFQFFGVKVSNTNLPETLAFMESKWATFFPGKVFEYTFLEESINDLYQAEERLSSIISYFAFIAIFISCFGLFGLAALLTKHRFKEIGIRKVLGASVGQILRSLAIDFIRLIALAMLLAIPFSWFFINRWMKDFAYRIDFPWWVPITTGLLVIVIAFITISTQTFRAASSNPVDALRSE